MTLILNGELSLCTMMYYVLQLWSQKIYRKYIALNMYSWLFRQEETINDYKEKHHANYCLRWTNKISPPLALRVLLLSPQNPSKIIHFGWMKTKYYLTNQWLLTGNDTICRETWKIMFQQACTVQETVCSNSITWSVLKPSSNQRMISLEAIKQPEDVSVLCLALTMCRLKMRMWWRKGVLKIHIQHHKEDKLVEILDGLSKVEPYTLTMDDTV